MKPADQFGIEISFALKKSYAGFYEMWITLYSRLNNDSNLDKSANWQQDDEYTNQIS